MQRLIDHGSNLGLIHHCSKACPRLVQHWCCTREAPKRAFGRTYGQRPEVDITKEDSTRA